MSLVFVADPSPARWLVDARVDDDRLVTFGPPGFEAWARLRFIPDPVRPGQSEAGVELPEEHRSDLEQSLQALAVLSAFTSTPGTCWCCLWEGYSDLPLPAGISDDALVVLPHRRYALLRASLADLADLGDWGTNAGAAAQVPPAFVWPEDRSWVFASDVDPHWAGVGASRAAIDALLREPRLDVVAADPTAPQPAYY